MTADDLEEEVRDLQAGEERKGSYASQSNGCCFDSVLEEPFTLGAAHARQQIQARKRNSTEGSKFQPLLCAWQEEKKEEEKSSKRSKRREQPVAKCVHQRQEGAMKAFRLVLFF